MQCNLFMDNVCFNYILWLCPPWMCCVRFWCVRFAVRVCFRLQQCERGVQCCGVQLGGLISVCKAKSARWFMCVRMYAYCAQRLCCPMQSLFFIAPAAFVFVCVHILHTRCVCLCAHVCCWFVNCVECQEFPWWRCSHLKTLWMRPLAHAFS